MYVNLIKVDFKNNKSSIALISGIIFIKFLKARTCMYYMIKICMYSSQTHAKYKLIKCKILFVFTIESFLEKFLMSEIDQLLHMCYCVCTTIEILLLIWLNNKNFHKIYKVLLKLQQSYKSGFIGCIFFITLKIGSIILESALRQCVRLQYCIVYL